MDKEHTQGKFESVYSSKVRAGKRRTYFFDVRRTKGDDFYITLTESTKRFNSDGYERHKIFLYKEDFNRFLDSLSDTINHVKTELMPDYDYDEFSRRQDEWEKRRAAENAASEEAAPAAPVSEVPASAPETAIPEETAEAPQEETVPSVETEASTNADEVEEDDMSW